MPSFDAESEKCAVYQFVRNRSGYFLHSALSKSISSTFFRNQVLPTGSLFDFISATIPLLLSSPLAIAVADNVILLGFLSMFNFGIKVIHYYCICELYYEC